MARAKEVATVNNQKKKTPKKLPKQNAYAVMMKNSVPSEVTVGASPCHNSLIFMSTSPSHIRATAVRVATLRRLALSVLFTIATTSYQTTCTVSERTFNKRQHANARYRVESLTLYALRHGGSSDTALKEEYRVDVSQCQLLEEKAGEGKAAKAARHLFGPPAAPVQGKNLGSDQPGERLVHAATLCSSPTGKAARTTASKGPS